ncbi:MAG: methylmalonyl-CoA epimerase [Anaerolineales bacterium]
MHIHHLAIVTEDMESALAFWRDALGLQISARREVPEEAAEIAFLPLGSGEIELVRPTTEDSGLGRYLAKRGGGLHHVCLEVDDLEAVMQRLRANGAELINEQPRQGADERRYAFVHPKSTGGVLLELYEMHGEPHRES